MLSTVALRITSPSASTTGRASSLRRFAASSSVARSLPASTQVNGWAAREEVPHALVLFAEQAANHGHIGALEADDAILTNRKSYELLAGRTLALRQRLARA